MTRWLALCLWCVPSLVQALSCAPWNVSDAYLQAHAAVEPYVVVHGTLSFDESLLPEVDMKDPNAAHPLRKIPAQFKGRAMVGRGADTLFEAPVTVHLRCYGPWCPRPAPGKVLAFLKQDARGYSVSTNPCNGKLFSNPTAQQVRQARTCLKGRRCEPSGSR